MFDVDTYDPAFRYRRGHAARGCDEVRATRAAAFLSFRRHLGDFESATFPDPFDATVVVPDICEKVLNPRTGLWQPSPKRPQKEWLQKCRQPFKNETKPGSGGHSGQTVVMSGDGKVEVKVQTFERTGWMLQQLLKLGAGEHIPGILDAYMVVDADTIFYDDYSPFPEDDPTGLQFNYMPGDARDCGNPPCKVTLTPNP